MSIIHARPSDRIVLLAIVAAVLQPASATAQPARPLERVPEIRRAYVPADELESILAGDRRGVLLTREKFEDLYTKARENAATTPRTNAALVLRGAAFRGRIDGDRLLLTGDVELEQFREGWAAFPLGISGLAIESATVGEEQARLGRKNGETTFLHEGRGPIALRLVLSAPLASIGNDSTAGFRLPGGSAATLEVDLPAGKRLLLDDGRLERPAAIEEAATYSVPVGGAGTRLTITDRTDDSGSDVLLFATTAAGLNVVPGEITWQAVTSIDVHGRTFDELVFAVPRTLEIAGVESTGLESWRLDDDPEDAAVTLVTLRYRQAFDGSRKVTLRGVLTAASGDRWTVPTLALRGANSHVARIVVRVPRDVRLEAVATDGVRSVAAAGIPREADGEVGTRRLVFDAFREDFTLEFSTASKPSSFQADLSTVVTVLDDRWELLSAARLEGRFGTTFDVEAELPASWEVTDIRVDGAETAWQEVPRAAGVRTIRVTLPEPLHAGESRSVEIAARSLPEIWPPTVAPVEVSLPEVRIPAATSLEAAYVVLCSDWFDCEPLDLVGLDPVPATVDDTKPTSPPVDNGGVSLKRLAYVYQNGRISGRLRVVSKPSRIAVRTLAFHRLDEDAERTHFEMELGITGGGLREWRLALPERLGDRLQFRVHQRSSAPVPAGAVRVVEHVPSEPADGSIDWTIRFDRRVRGRIVLAVDAEAPRGEGRSSVPVPTIPAAERHHGYVALEATARQRLAAKAVDANDEPLWEITPTDLPAAATYEPRERVVSAFRFVLPGANVAAIATRFDRVGVPNAVCQRMDIESAIGGGDSGSDDELAETSDDSRAVLRHYMQAVLTTSSLTTLGIALPDDASVWSATIDGEPVELERAGEVHVVNWPVGEPGVLRTLDLHYVTTGDSLGSVDQPAPRLLLPGGEAIEVLRYDWRLHHPVDTALVRSRGVFEPTSTTANLSFLGELRTALGRVSPRRAGGRLFVIVVLAAAAFLLTMAIRQWGPLWPLVTAGTVGLLALFIFVSTFVSRGGIGGASADMAAKSAAGERSRRSSRDMKDGRDEWAFVGETANAPEFDKGSSEAMPGADKPMDAGGFESPEPTAPMQPTPDPNDGNDDDVADERTVRELLNSLDDRFKQPLEGTQIPGQKAESERLSDGFDSKEQLDSEVELVDQLQRRREIRTLRMEALVEQSFRESSRALAGHDADTAAKLVDRTTAAVRAAEDLDPAVRDGLTGRLRERRRVIENVRAQLAQREARFDERLASLEADEQTGGRLSVPLVFEAPGGPSQRFRYIGTADDDARLVVSVVDRSSARTWCLVSAAVVLLVFWMLRRLDVAARTLIVLLAFTLALGIGPLLEASQQPALEGLLIGSLAGLVLWGLIALHDRAASLAPQPAEPTGSSKAATATLFLAAVLLGGSARAEDPADPFQPQQQEVGQPQALQQRIQPPNANAANPFEGNQPDTANTNPTNEDWTVIVPYEAGTDPLEGDRVVVPRAIFVRLWNTAYPDDPLDAEAPPNAVVSSATYEARLETGEERPRIAIEATFVVHGFASSPTTVVLPVGKVPVRSARIADQTVPIRPANEGVAVELGEGRHEVVLAFDVPARTAGPSGRFEFHVPDVPAGRLAFSKPAGDLLVRVDGAANTFRLEGDGDEASILVPFGTKSGTSTVEWRPRTDDGVGDAIVQVETRTTLEITDAGVLATSTYEHVVRRGRITELRFVAPASVPVRRIVGKDVGGWSFDGEGDERQLSVLLRRAVDDETTVGVELFVDGDPTSKVAPLPGFAPIDVARESGRVGVRVAPHLVARLLRGDGLERSDLEDFGTARGRTGSEPLPLRYAFRFSERPLDLAFEVSRRPSSLEASSQHSIRVGRHEVLIDSRLSYSLGSSPLQRVVATLPPGYVPLEVRAVALDDWYVRTSGDERELVVEFDATRAGEVEIVLRGEVRRAEGETEVSLVVPLPSEVVASRASLGVFVEDGLRVTPSSFGDWKRTDVERAEAAVARRAARRAEFVLSTEETSPTATVVEVRPAVVKWSGGDVLNLLTVDDDKVSSVFVLEWRFGGAAADRFVFTAPESLDDRLDFVEPSLRQVERSEAVDGVTRWTLSSEQPVGDRFLVVARAVSPPAGDELVGPVPVLESPSPGGERFDVLPAQNRYAVTVNGSLQEAGEGRSTRRVAGRRPIRLDLVPNDGLEPVQVRDIAFLGQSGDLQRDLARATTLVRLRNRAVVPKWRVTTSTTRRGGAALVQQAELLTIFDADGTWRGRGVYRVTNRDRQFLALDFPDDVRPLAAHVRGEAVTIVTAKVGDRSVDMIPIPLSTAGEAGFDVAVVFVPEEGVGTLETAFGLVEKSLQPPAPRVVSPEESAEYGIPVSQTTWTIYLPKGLTARADEDAERNSFTGVGNRQPAPASSVTPYDTSMSTEQVETLGDYERGEQQFELAKDLYDSNFAPQRRERSDDDGKFRYHLKQQPNQPGGEPTQGNSTPSTGKPAEGKPGQGQPGSGKDGQPGEELGASTLRDFRAAEIQNQVRELESRLEEAQRAKDLPKPKYGFWGEEPFGESKIVGGRSSFGREVFEVEDAEEVAEGAVNLRPGNGPAAAARFSRDGKVLVWGGEVSSTPGSLSLDFDLPTEGTAFTFTKSGGEPSLGILVRREDVAARSIGIGWAAAWVVLLVAACLVVSKGTEALVTFVVAAITALGAAAFLLTDGDLAGLGLLAFLAGALVLCVRCGRRPKPLAET